VLIVGLLQALQGDEKWAKLLLERGYGKVADKIEGGARARWNVAPISVLVTCLEFAVA
jgi:hypothetical protein